MKTQLDEKSRISSSAKEKVLSLAEALVEKRDIYALFAYGSRVAGYAKRDSDYDMVVVTKGFENQPPAPRKEDEESGSSPLVVDESTLLDEARHPSAGDFAVGRLLNVYEPIVNAEFLRHLEFEYKRRVMVEQLIEIQTDYGEFSSNLVLPYEYFIFDKLHKMATAYPEATYGYTRTYTCDHARENLESALEGFRAAAESLAFEGIVESDDESVRIFRGKRRSEALSNLLKMYPLTTRAAIRYALHDSAKKAGIEFKTKPVSKLKATGRIHHPPMHELDHPKSLLRLEEGIVFDDHAKMIDELAHMSGFREAYDYEEKNRGDIINSTKELQIQEGDKQAKYILKHFAELKAAKWAILDVWSLAAKKFNMSPLSRLTREVEGVRKLRELRMRTHRIIGVALSERTLVTEYVEGEPLSKFVQEVVKGESKDAASIEEYGRVLAKLHKAGFVYGDTKPQNVLVAKDGGIELLDLEQAVENGDDAWDLAEFLYFSATHLEQEDDDKKDGTRKTERITEPGLKLVADSFLEGYRSENGGDAIRRARNLRYVAPFLPVLSPSMMKVVRRELEEYSF